MLSCSVWFSAPSFWMGGGLESRCVGGVYGADGAVHHHSSKNSVQKTICCNSKSNARDDGRMYSKHVELRIHQYNYLVASILHFTVFYEEDARSDNSQIYETDWVPGFCVHITVFMLHCSWFCEFLIDSAYRREHMENKMRNNFSQTSCFILDLAHVT